MQHPQRPESVSTNAYNAENPGYRNTERGEGFDCRLLPLQLACPVGVRAPWSGRDCRVCPQPSSTTGLRRGQNRWRWLRAVCLKQSCTSQLRGRNWWRWLRAGGYRETWAVRTYPDPVPVGIGTGPESYC